MTLGFSLNRAVASKSLKEKHGFSGRWKQWSDIPDSVKSECRSLLRLV